MFLTMFGPVREQVEVVLFVVVSDSVLVVNNFLVGEQSP